VFFSERERPGELSWRFPLLQRLARAMRQADKSIAFLEDI
jgi:hypothetical protein